MTTNSGRGANVARKSGRGTRIGAVPQRTLLTYFGPQSWRMERHDASDRCLSTHDRLELVVRVDTSGGVFRSPTRRSIFAVAVP